MSNLTFEYIFIALLGMTIHIMFSILNRKNKNISISFSYYLCDIDNWIRVALSITSIVALLIMSESLSDIFGIKMSSGSSAKDVFAFLTGYLNHSIIKDVLKIFKK